MQSKSWKHQRTRQREEERGRDLKLEGERREDNSAFLLENLADIVTGGGRKRQANRLPHLSKSRRETKLSTLPNFINGNDFADVLRYYATLRFCVVHRPSEYSHFSVYSKFYYYMVSW